MSTINIRESLRQLDDDSFCKYDLLTMYDSCPLLDEDKQEIAKLLYDKEDPEVIYQKLCTYFCDDDTSEIDAFNDFIQPGTFEVIVNECVNKLKESCSDAQYNDVANQLEVIKDGELYTTGLAPIEIETGDIEIFVDGNYDSPLAFDSAEDAVNYITDVVLNKLASTSVDSGDDDIMVYTVYDIVEDDDNRLTAKCMNESTNDFQDIKLGKINSQKANELLNNILNNPNYKITDEVKKKIYDNSAPWGLAVQVTPAIDVDGTNGLLATGDFGGEASFGESIETNFEKDDRVTDGNREGTVIDYDSQKVLVEWDYSETEDIEWINKSALELIKDDSNPGFLPNMEYCPACGGTRFNVRTGYCVDCGYDEGSWGYYNESYIPIDNVKKDIQSYLNYHLSSNEDYVKVTNVQNVDKDTVAVEYEVHVSIPIGNGEYESDTEYRSLSFKYKDGKWQPVITESKYDVKTKINAKKLVDKAKADSKKLSMKDAEEIIDQSFNDKVDNIDDFYKFLDLEESKNSIATGKEARKYLWNKIENSKDTKGYWKIEDDFTNGGNITIVKDVSDIPNGYKYRFSFLDNVSNTPVEMDAYNNDLDWYIVDYLSDVKLEESVSGRYVWFSYNDIKNVKPKPQQVIDAYNSKYPDYDNPLTGINSIELAGRSYPEKELHYIVTDTDGNQFWAIVGNVSKDMLDTVQESQEDEIEPKLPTFNELRKQYKNYTTFKDKEKNSGLIRDLCDQLENKKVSYDIYNHKKDNGMTIFYDDCELVESLSPYKKEEFKKQLQDELYDKFIDLARTPEWGFENLAEIGDYLMPTIDVNDYEGEYDNDIEVEFRAEVNYREMEDVCNTLDKVVKKYDKNAYFEPVQPGIAVAYLKFPKKLKEDLDDKYVQVDLHSDDEYKYSGNGGRSWVPINSSNIDTWDTEADAVENGKKSFRKSYKYKRDWDVVKLPKSYTEDFEDDEIVTGEQEFDSAATSINSNKLPAVYSMVDFTPGQVVIDFGGGRFDNAVNYLKDKDVTLLVYDPYNRSAEHNKEVLRVIRENGGADAAINSNVLNVIKEPEARQQVLKNIKKLVKPGAPIYITVYEGSGKGNEGPTKAGYQLNRKTSGYIDEISQIFPNVKRRGKLITAINESFSSSGLRQANMDAIDYFMEFEDIYTFPKGKFLATDWEELRDGISMGMDSDIEIAEGIMKYLQKEIDFNNKYKEIYEDDPQAELTLEIYNKVKKEYEKEIAKYESTNYKKWDMKESTNHDYDKEFYSLVDKLGSSANECGADADDFKGNVTKNGFSIVFNSFVDKKDAKSFPKNIEKSIEKSLSETRFSEWVDTRIYRLTDKQVKQTVPQELADKILSTVVVYEIQVDGRCMEDLDKLGLAHSLEEANYGGAFDIDDDQYFTKEEIVDVAEKVCEHLNEIYSDKFDVSDVYMETPTIIHVEITSKEGNWASANAKIDMRKIKKPSDIMKYNVVIGDLVYNLRQELDELYTDNSMFTESASEWRYVTSKMVPDSDGFLTDYTWYENTKDGRHVFIFGDNDLYDDVDSNYADWETDSYSEAMSWFNNYHGFDEEDV